MAFPGNSPAHTPSMRLDASALPTRKRCGATWRSARRAARITIVLIVSVAMIGGTANGQENKPAPAAQSREAEWGQLGRGAREAYQRGEFSQGVELATRALALAEETFGPDHANTLLSLNNLAALYAAEERYSEAEPLYIRALEAKERTLGRENPSTITSVNNLASLYGDQRRYAEAEPLYVRLMEVRERTLGRDHPDTLTTISNLADLYGGLGRYAEAEPLYLRALDASERMRGREHPDTLLTLNYLASMYNAQGRHGDAERLLLRLLEVRERVQGREHPDTLHSVNDLATLYDNQHRYAEAEPLHARALEARERLLGREHPDALAFVDGLASLYHRQGRDAQAEPLLARALAGRERALGREHPDTLSSVNNLAVLYIDQGRQAEAEPLLLRALEARERLFGSEHPGTLNSVSHLAALYDTQGRYAEAEPLHARALEARERLLGREHPDTLDAVNGLAVLYHRQGRYAEAEPLYVRGLEARERLFGRDHPDTLTLVSNLAVLYRNQGRYVEAGPLHMRALEAREMLLGRDHPDTLYAVHHLATLYSTQGRYAEAEPLHARALEARERVLGREHPDTLVSVNNLGTMYDRQGRYAEAEPLYARALEAMERVLGRNHPETASSAGSLTYLRLRRPASAPFAIDPARLAVASRRLRFASGEGGYADAQRDREQTGLSYYFVNLADAAWTAAAARPGERTGLTGEAFSALQDAVAGTTSQAVIQTAIQRFADQAGSHIGALVRERESLSSQWGANSQAYAGALPQSGPAAEQLRQRLRARRDAIEARMTEIDASLRRDFPEYFALVRPEALDVAAAQALLAPDEAILMVVPTEFGTHVMGISRTHIEWVRSSRTNSEVDGAVGQLLGNIRVTMAGERFTYDRQTAFALYRDIVAPVASILEGKRHVFIVAAGSLTSIPFGILVTEEPQGANDNPQDLRTTKWFADAHALINVPSIQSLQFLRRSREGARQPESSAPSFVGFGNPVLDGPADPAARQLCGRGRGAADVTPAMIAAPGRTRGGGMIANVAAIRLLCPLPGTAVELENMRTAFRALPAALFVGQNSTEFRLRSMDLSHVRILAFATHGVLARELDGAAEPGLVFTPPAVATEGDDGYLTASEVSALRLDADWVILSACDTAGGSAAGAPGLSGLARAFFYAGARNLLASHWKVADDASAILTVRTVELMREDPALSRAEALQRSMREVRENGDPDNSAWAHPGVWAPFSLIGDGAN